MDDQPPRQTPPAPLTAAAGLVLVEGLATFGLGIVEAVHTTSNRIVMGATTALFFLLYGAALVAFSWAMRMLRPWARGPVVLTQLIVLGMAWSFRGHDTRALSVTGFVVAVLVLAGILHPASVDALNREEHRRTGGS